MNPFRAAVQAVRRSARRILCRVRRRSAPAALAAAAAAGVALAAATPAAAQIQAVSLVQNLEYPLHVTAPRGDTERLFIVSQLGEILILKNGTLLPQPFLDVSAELTIGFSFEQGLLGLEFDPDYDTNGHFYINFVRDDGTTTGISTVRRYTVSANPDSADENSGLQILELKQPQTNHNAGNLVFGPDSLLWIGWGDGGSDPAVSQDSTTWLGKMLRIDPRTDDFPADSLRHYSVPADNPFVGDPAVLDEIWAFGLRNPWRYRFDSLTGDLYIGDVGGNFFEEIDFVAAGDPGGMNFGWPLMEADTCNIPPTNCDPGGLTGPIYSYPHTLLFNHAVVAGPVYRGSELPAGLYGHFFFADESWPGLWSFRYENGQVTELTDWSTQVDLTGALKFPASWHEDDSNEIYVVEYRTAALGEVWKIVPDPAFTGVTPLPDPASGVSLGAPRPNPFRAATHFQVSSPAGVPLTVSVYDLSGRRVRTLRAGPGDGAVVDVAWDGRDAGGRMAAAGVYFIRARAGEWTAGRRVVFTP